MKRISSLLLAAAVCGGAHAQTLQQPIVITASRTPITADDALASVSVLTREQIEQTPAKDLPGLLATLPGVHLSRNGGRGQQSSLYLRGTNKNHVLVLVNGMRIGSATVGTAALGNLPLEQIERIEVVRGPRSTLYGSDAIGGVIQIFTRDDVTFASVGGGTQGTASVSAGIGGSTGRVSGGISISGFRTDGFDATDERNFAHDPDRDGYRQRSLNLRGSFDATDDLSFDASLLHTEDEVEFDGTPDETEGTTRIATVGADWLVLPSWRLRLTGAETLTDQDSRPTGGDRFATRRSEISWQNDFFLSDHETFTLGLDWRNERIETDVTDFLGNPLQYEETSRENRAVFAQYQWYGDTWDLQAALRHDDNEAFGEVTTGNLAAGYRFDNGVRVFAAHGSAFKAPTFNDLYYPDVGFFRGNPELRPERSRTSEVGLQGGDFWRWEVNAFHTEIDDLIIYDATTRRSENVDEARIRGAEASLSTTLAGFNAGLSLTLLDAEDTATGNDLPRRPDTSARLSLARALGPVRLGGAVSYHGDAYDDRQNATELDAYTVVDLSAAWQVAPDWTLRGEVTNLFDEDYQSADTYNAPGRAVFVSVNWQPAAP